MNITDDQILIVIVVVVVLFLLFKKEAFLNYEPAPFVTKDNYCGEGEQLVKDCTQENFVGRVRKSNYHPYAKQFTCNDNYKFCQ